MLLGIDFGTRKVGLAVSEHKSDAIPLPLTIIRYKKYKELKSELHKAIADYDINAFVVGALPKYKSGDEEKQMQFESFITMLKDDFNLPIYFVDESRSTKAALNFGKEDPDFKEKFDDAISAQVILQTNLNKHGVH